MTDAKELASRLEAEVLSSLDVPLPSGFVSVARLLRSDVRAPEPIARFASCWAPNKPALVYDDRTTWAEFVIVAQLERHGWHARWIKNWTGGREFCQAIGNPAPLPPHVQATFSAIDRKAASRTGGGAWDVLAWRQSEYLFIESKQHGSSDKLRLGQIAWMAAALELGHDASNFAVVEYDAGPPVARAMPVVAGEDRGRKVAITRIDADDLRPTPEQMDEARSSVAMRGWQLSKSSTAPLSPKAMRDDDGQVHACEHRNAGRQNPARWPLFFVRRDHAGELLWTCTMCKKAQADARGDAIMLVDAPTASYVPGLCAAPRSVS